MEQLEKFNEIWIHMHKDLELSKTLTRMIILPILFLVFLLAGCSTLSEDYTLVIYCVPLLLATLHVGIQPCVHMKDNGKVVSVYEKLKYMPVKRWEIFKHLVPYVWKEAKFFTIVTALAQCISCIIERQIRWFNVLFIAGIFFVSFTIGILDILPLSVKKLYDR